MAATSEDATMDVDAYKSIVPVVVRHQGKKYDVDVDVSEPGVVFKYQIYSLTGVQPENQKILIKGRQVKDDTDLGTLGLKPAQAIMVLGQPGPEPVRFQAPTEKTRFIEDMSADEAAGQNALAAPSGLTNLGNTCYLNAALQSLRAIPEVQNSVVKDYVNDPRNATAALTNDLREVFVRLSSSHSAFIPLKFLTSLRTFNPRFAEQSRTGQGYAQQDAEEAWSFIVNNLRQTLKIKDQGSEDAAGGSSDRAVNAIDRYMAGEVEKTVVCDEPEGRTDAQSKPERDTFLMLECHISISTNHLRDGLLAGLVEKIEKNSEELGRNASFTSSKKISRLPKYLSVHFIRFYWKREIQKKAKIMRKVSFPQEMDVSEMCTEELRAKLLPVREKVREVRKEIEEIERTNKKRKRRLSEGKTEAKEEASSSSSGSGSKPPASKKTEGEAKDGEPKEGKAKEGEEVEYKTDAQIEAEKRASLEKAKEELYELAKPRLEEDPYANHTGLYELRAVVAHQGAGADSGHYTAFVKKGTIVNPKTGQLPEEDGNWWWFNDENVTEVSSDRITALAGGGESHSALILLYGSVPLPLPEEHLKGKFSQS